MFMRIGVLATLALLSLTACTREPQEYILPPAAPRIESFTASATSVKPGETLTLAFRATGATEASIIDHLGASPELDGTTQEGSANVQPSEDSFYVLRLTGPGGKVSAFVRIEVDGALAEAALVAVPPTVDPGQEVQLLWTAHGAATASLSGDDGESRTVDASAGAGMVTVYPARNTTYTLSAMSPVHTAPLTATASVVVRPRLAEFALSPKAVPRQGTISFALQVLAVSAGTFEITEASFGSVASGQLDASGNATASFEVPERFGNGEPVIDGTPLFFTLKVTGPGESFVFEDTARAKVGTGPEIRAFDVPGFVTVGTPVTVSWDVDGAASLRLVRAATGLEVYSAPAGSPALSKGSFTLPSPTSTETYWLEVEDSDGNQDKRSGEVRVDQIPTVALTVPAAPVAAMGTANVSYTSTHAARVVIRLKNGPQLEERTLANGAVSFRVASTVWVVAEAYNRAGYKVSTEGKVRVTPLATGSATVLPSPAKIGDTLSMNVDLSSLTAIRSLAGLPSSIIRTSTDPVHPIDPTFYTLEGASHAKSVDFGGLRQDAVGELREVSGFTFPFAGTTRTEFFVSTNGVLTFANAGALPTQVNLLTANTAPALIAPFWVPLAIPEPRPENPNPGVLYGIEGNAFPRTLVIQWNDLSLASASARITFQARLSESGAVEFVYRDLSSTLAGYAGGEFSTIGVNLGYGFFAAQHSQPGVATVQPGFAVELLNPLNDGPHSLQMPAVQRGTLRFFAVDSATAQPSYVGFAIDARVFSPGDVVINEVMPYPRASLQSNDGVWLELFNPSPNELDLAGLTITSTAEPVRSFVIPAGELVAGGGHYVLAGSNLASQNGGLPRVDEPFGAALAFDIGQDRVELKVDSAVISALGWEDTTEAQSISAPQRTVTSSGAYLSCPETASYGSVNSRGSPGAHNRPCFDYELSSIPVRYQDISLTGQPLFPVAFNLAYASMTLDVSQAPVLLWRQPNSNLEINGCGWIGPQGTPFQPGYCFGSPDPVKFPSALTPNGAIVPFGDRLDDQIISSVYVSNIFAQRFDPGQSRMEPAGHWVIQWHRVEHVDAFDDLNFQVKLFDDGRIEFHYGLMFSKTAARYGEGSSATIWLENPAGTAALSLGSLTAPPSISSHSAYRFAPVVQ